MTKLSLQDYPHHFPLQTRWQDNDIYGHVNNVVYYSYFDTAVNHYLINKAGLDIHRGAVIGLVVETQCQYFAPLAFPDDVTAGVKVSHVGNSSVRYDIGLFQKGHDDPAAQGHFIHVYVDRENRRPCPLPPPLRDAVLQLAQPQG